MSNLNLNTMSNSKQSTFINSINSSNLLSIIDNQSSNTKTNKQKLVYSIEKEIQSLFNRESLTLKQISKKGENYINKKGENSTYKNDRFENRFWKNPSNGIVTFNLKYKGKILPIDGMENKSFSCENSVESLLKSLTYLKSVIGDLDETDKLFNNKIFKTSK